MLRAPYILWRLRGVALIIWTNISGKGKGTVHPERGHEGAEGE